MAMDLLSSGNLRRTQPLVSVGIPTYSRPEGLRRTLRLITAQTCENLEIIVSDNSSPNEDTETLVREFMRGDGRIEYYRQATNIGTHANFQFVLSKATGEYFMWAADDDEWQPEFVQVCLSKIGSAGSVMTGFNVLLRASGQSVVERLPAISYAAPAFVNATNFLNNLQPSLIYGLHRRDTILFVRYQTPFDFYDCYFVLRQILRHGFEITTDVLFTAGVDANEYVKKPVDPQPGRLLAYDGFYLNAALAIVNSARLSWAEKQMLLVQLARVVVGLFFHHERDVNGSTTHAIRSVQFSAKLLCYWWSIARRARMKSMPSISREDVVAIAGDLRRWGFYDAARQMTYAETGLSEALSHEVN
jgi:glycosyltransferase involved in cell wall biosynthesis